MGREPSGLLGAIWSALRTPVPPGHRGYTAFGWLLAMLFLTQVATGILLSMYFQASPAMVSESVQYLMRDVSWGWLIRGIHHWTGQGMVALCVLQLLRIFLGGGYRGVGASHWHLGLVMGVLVVALSYSGDLLVWDNVAYWRMTRSLELVETFPLIGEPIALILRGGTDVNATSLGRLYATHSLLLPWALASLLVLSLWLFWRRSRDAEEDAP
jgi:quinol-cytochrome oxidoreductase complex cytochrome b subunit